jgi:hypothetical protein
MQKFIFTELIRPLITRIGSAIGVYLASADVFATGEIDVLVAAANILGGYAVDLVVRRVL